ncbi:hypothetical protein [Streptomyces sp. NRRL F-5135]|uniref:hypothetical protein n=1 Tax=Streptomyces sp. NRRL F-5135 TaxID=1463858 RepID=UPI000AADED08|nr:hypothetical protein [Streptomyces sp. NRRL F-5135]
MARRTGRRLRTGLPGSRSWAGDEGSEQREARPARLASWTTDDGSQLVDAAGKTFADGLAELIGDTLDGSSAATAVRDIPKLRSALERNQVGTPTG